MTPIQSVLALENLNNIVHPADAAFGEVCVRSSDC